MAYVFFATGDVHLSNELPHAKPLSNGLTDRFVHQLDMMAQIIEIAGDHEIYIIGDLFDKAKLDPITLVETLKIMQAGGRWRILPGNHDANSLTGGRFNVEMFAHLNSERFKLLDGSFDVSDTWRIHAVPFASIEENASTIAKIQANLPKDRRNLLLLHQAILGCKVDGAFLCDSHGLKASEITKGFDRAIAGHFHSHQMFGRPDKESGDQRGMYMGAPMQHRYSDEGEDRGIWKFTLHDDGTFEREFINLHMPQFWTINPGGKRPEKARKGDYIRVSARMTDAEWSSASVNVQDTVSDLTKDGFVASAKHVPEYQHDARMTIDASLLGHSLQELTGKYLEIPSVEIGSLDKMHLLKIGRELATIGDADRDETTVGSVQLCNVSIQDIFCFGNVSLNLQNRGLVFVTGTNKDSDGAANNGCGKTSIYKAISWILYGKTVDGETGDRVIRKGANQAYGTASFLSGGKRWIVERTRVAGTTKLDLIAPSGEKFNSKKKDKQRQISDLIGLDFQGFRSTVLYGRTDPNCFSAPGASDSDRKDILHSILRTSMFATALNAAKLLRDNSELELTAAREDLAGVRGKLTATDIEAQERLAASWASRKVERLASVQAEKNAAESRLGSLKTDQKKIDAIVLRQAEIAQLQEVASAKVTEVATAKKRLKTLEQAENDANTAVTNKTKEAPKVPKNKTEMLAAEMAGKVKSAAAHIANLSVDHCPVCRSKMSEGTPADYIAGLKAEYANLQSMHTKLNATAEAEKAQVKSIRDKFDSELAALQEIAKTAKSKRVSAKKKLAEIESSVPAIDTKEIAALAKQLADLQNLDSLRQEMIRTITAHATAIASIEAEINPHESQIADLRKKKAKFEAEKIQLEADVNLAASTLAAAKFWVHGFGPSGLPSIILDSVMKPLTERTNHYLEILADGDIVGEFRTQKTLASGESRDKIEMSWTIEGNDDVTPSDGQQTKIRVAVDLALMDLASERSSVDLLLFDEVLDGLDSEGMQRMLDLLLHLRARKHSVFVISHAHGMTEAFETGLMVTKSGKVSSVREIAPTSKRD